MVHATLEQDFLYKLVKMKLTTKHDIDVSKNDL